MGRDGFVSFHAAIDSVRKTSPQAIVDASPELEDIALKRVLSQVTDRTIKPEAEADLFSDYPGLKQCIRVERAQGDKVVSGYIPLGQATLKELSDWLDYSRRAKSTRRKSNPLMAGLLRDLSQVNGTTPGTTIAASLLLKKAAGDRSQEGSASGQ